MDGNATLTSSEVSSKTADTAISHCVQNELRRYFDMLDGEEPTNVYHLVMRQAEHALIKGRQVWKSQTLRSIPARLK